MLESPVAAHQKVDAGLHRPPQSLPEPFVFVPITSGEAARGRGAAKRIVRAHVTRVQHAKSSTLNSHNLENWTVKPYIHRDSTTARRKPRQNGAPARRRGNAGDDADEQTSEKQSRAVVIVPKLAAGGSHDDPFWTYPVDRQPYLTPIFAHCTPPPSPPLPIQQTTTTNPPLADIQNVAVEIPDLDGPNAKGLLRRCWFPLAMTEAATMYAVLLMAASHFAIVNPAQGALIDLLALKARALSEINTALANPKRAVSDAMIGAVAKMAAYEAVFGDSEVFVAHMKGLQMMLKMRGGLATLGLDGLLERMLVWIDLNAAHLTGKAVALGGTEMPTKVIFAAPDPYHFAGIS